MANEEHVARLQEDVAAWQHWREEHPLIRPDLSGSDLSGAFLHAVALYGSDLHGTLLIGTDLNDANLHDADLREANLREADLSGSDLHHADLSGTDLSSALLSGAVLYEADLRAANLHAADLSGADLRGADLRAADLSKAVLYNTDLRGAALNGADLRRAKLAQTNLNQLDLRQVKGLDKVEHFGPSDIGIQTIYQSHGEIPEAFLRGVGVPDNFIEYMHSLTGQAFQYYSCFISYASKDQAFAERLYADLQSKGVRCWFAPHHLKIGDKILDRIDESIRLYDKLLVILSKHSVESDWVEDEVTRALDKERQHPERTVLFPIRLDEAVMTARHAWASGIRLKRHIGDFSRWKMHDRYQQAFTRLLRDLQAPDTPPPAV